MGLKVAAIEIDVNPDSKAKAEETLQLLKKNRKEIEDSLDATELDEGARA